MFNLSPSDIERIDRESMRILWEIGIRLDDAPLRIENASWSPPDKRNAVSPVSWQLYE